MQNRWLPLDPVQSECPHCQPLIAESADIIVIAIPGQLIGTDGVRLSIIRNIALLIHIKICVVKPNLAVQIDGIVNHVDAVVAGMIAALVAVRDGNMPPEPLRISSVVSVSSFAIRLLEIFGVMNLAEESASIRIFSSLTSNGRPL